jgi:hypothetical protein
MKPHHYILIGAAGVALLAIAFLLGRVTAPLPPPEPLSRDTVTVTHTDTITREKPVYYARTVTDTLRLVVRDTVRQQDTLYLAVAREQRAYRDTSYEAWVSGVQPSLDSIRIYAPVRCVTVTERVPVKVRSRWGLGVSAGYGASMAPDKTVVLSPFIGIGVSYNFLTW